MKLRYGLAIASIALAGCLSACASVSSAADVPGLDGTSWVLSALPGRTLLPGTTATLHFAAGKASGTDGCNRYTVPYTASGATLKVEPHGASTQMACPPAVMQQAGAFMAGLAGARSYRVADGQLQLLGADGAVLARLAPQSQGVAGTSWRVTGYNNGKQAVTSVLGGTTLTMEFAADGRAGGSAGCNSYSAAYTSSGAAMSFGPAAATRMMCESPPGIMEQEYQFLKALATVATARQEGDRLELRTAAGALAVSLTREHAQ
jgi:heat shock protein HslJ